MKVVFISPVSRVINHYRPPLALMYLSGYLKKNGIDAKIIDIPLKNQVRDKEFHSYKKLLLFDIQSEILKEIKNIDTDIVCITCYTPEIMEVEDLARQIKSAKPKVKIIVGGIHPTLYPQDFLNNHSLFDFIVVGEGEVTLLELVKSIRSGAEDYATIKGIDYFDNKQNKAVITANRPLVENLDSISFPDYSDLDMEFYTTASPYSIRGVFARSFYILSSRGCPSSCIFCVSKKLRESHGMNKFVRLRSSLSLYEEVNELRQKYKVDSFYFIDDLFTLKKENVYEFCRLMIKNKTRLIWACSSKVNTVSYDMLKIMKQAGCVQIDFGVEKGSDEALRYLKKGITVSQIKNTFGNCRKLGIRTFANILVNTPGETEKDLKDIISLLKKIKPNIVSFNVFTPYPGCEIYDFSCREITASNYPMLMDDPNDLILKYPQKFKFAKHQVNLKKWVEENTKKYNKIFLNISIYFTKNYLRSFLSSREKKNYLKQFKFLIKEILIQKFFR